MSDPETNPVVATLAAAVVEGVVEAWRTAPPPPPHLATRKEVADRWHVNEKTVKRMVVKGLLVETMFSPKWRHFLWEDVFDCERRHRCVIEEGATYPFLSKERAK